MMPEEPKGEVSYDAMLPELRAGLRHAAERRARQEFPGVRSWEVMLVILLFGGGTKKFHQRDIEDALARWIDHKRRARH